MQRRWRCARAFTVTWNVGILKKRNRRSQSLSYATYTYIYIYIHAVRADPVRRCTASVVYHSVTRDLTCVYKDLWAGKNIYTLTILKTIANARANLCVCVCIRRKKRRTKINQITGRWCVRFLTKWSGNIGRPYGLTTSLILVRFCFYSTSAAEARVPASPARDGRTVVVRFTCQKLINPPLLPAPPPPLRTGALFHFSNGFAPDLCIYIRIILLCSPPLPSYAHIHAQKKIYVIISCLYARHRSIQRV